MKKIIVAILCSIVYNLSASAQDLQIKVEKNLDGTLSRGRIEKNQRTGLWVTYDSQSNPKRYEEYKEGIRHGYFVENDEHGHPFMEGWFYEGKPVGKHIIFSHGNLLKEMDFDKGTVKEYYENGTLKKDGLIKDGLPEGKLIQYYDNGNKLSENNYTAGKKMGPQKYYYQSGSVQAEYSTLNDNLNGAYKDYHENGKLATEGTYENNMKQDLWKEYDEAGKLVKQTKYKNDTEVK